jgi:uncharacterized protein (TIGR00725 family)
MAAYVGIIGGGQASRHDQDAAESVGRHLAEAGAVVVCGGLGGVMAGACRGARQAGGMTVGILPGLDRAEANEWVEVAVPTGLGEGRNLLVVRASDAIVAIGGEYGTLSEIGFALRTAVPVVGLGTWTLTRPDGGGDPGVVTVEDPAAAAALALELVRARR